MNNNALYRAMRGGYWGLFPDGWQPITRETYAFCLFHNSRQVENNDDLKYAARLFVAVTVVSLAFVVVWF